MTPELLMAATGCTPGIAAGVAADLTLAMQKYGIDTNRRQAHFLAQTAHESGLFARVEEDLHYRAEGLARVWPSRFYLPPDDARGRLLATDYAMQPAKLANAVYAGRLGNGDTASGDGWKYRGRGFIQLTGKSNYIAFNRDEPTYPSVTFPDVLASAEGASVSAAWFWNSRNCNKAADTGLVELVTRAVNGGTIGLDHRVALTKRAMAAFGITF